MTFNPKGWRSIFSMKRRICFPVPMMSTSVFSMLQSTEPRDTAASPPSESISCLMMLATFGFSPSMSRFKWLILDPMDAIP